MKTPKRALWLESLIKKNKWTVGAELGVQEGRTYIHLLQSCPNLTLFGVDIWTTKDVRKRGNTNGWIDQTSIGYGYYLNIKKLLKQENMNHRGTTLRMMTHEATEYVDDKSLDFIFIDASHTYKDVLSDIANWSKKVKDTGYITGHDLSWTDVNLAINDTIARCDSGPDDTWIAHKRNLKLSLL